VKELRHDVRLEQDNPTAMEIRMAQGLTVAVFGPLGFLYEKSANCAALHLPVIRLREWRFLWC